MELEPAQWKRTISRGANDESAKTLRIFDGLYHAEEIQNGIFGIKKT